EKWGTRPKSRSQRRWGDFRKPVTESIQLLDPPEPWLAHRLPAFPVGAGTHGELTTPGGQSEAVAHVLATGVTKSSRMRKAAEDPTSTRASSNFSVASRRSERCFNSRGRPYTWRRSSASSM